MPQERGVTLRSIAFGLCLSVAVGLLGNWVRFVLSGSFMSYSHMPMGNLILFLLSILICAPLAWGLGRRFVFSPTEWVTIFCMGFIGSLGPTYGSSGDLVGFMVAPHYFATPENEWAAFLHPYMPGWLIPKNEGDAMVWFYKGVPQGASIPWGVWAVPLVWWFLFICAVGFACVCVSTLFHRQWSENEKLVYPALAPIVDMTTRVGSGKWFFPEFMQGKAFWAGFGLTASVLGWNMVSWFYPLFPSIPLGPKTWVAFSRHDPSIYIFLSTVVISFSYFATLEILFSIWFFDLLFIVEGGILNRLGVRAISPYYGTGRYYWQTSGAFFSLALWGVWVARLHFADVFRKALHPEKSTLDDSKELLSYRGALIGLIVGCLYIAVWLNRVGMELKMIALLIPSMLLVYTTVAKILADSGLIYVNSPLSGWGLAVRLLGGSHTLTILTRATLGLSSRVINHYRGFAMGSLAHINRLAERSQGQAPALLGRLCGLRHRHGHLHTLYHLAGIHHRRLQHPAQLVDHPLGHGADRGNRERRQDPLLADRNHQLLVFPHRSRRHGLLKPDALPFRLVADSSHRLCALRHGPVPADKRHHLRGVAGQTGHAQTRRRCLLPEVQGVFHRHAHRLHPSGDPRIGCRYHLVPAPGTPGA